MRTLILFFAAALLLTSCIKEKLADCPPENINVQVSFTFDTPCETGAGLPDDLKTVTVFIFDQHMLYSGQQTGTLSGQPSMTLSLPNGEYHLFAWGGFSPEQLKGTPLVAGITKLSDLSMQAFSREADGSYHNTGTILYRTAGADLQLSAQQTIPLTLNLERKTKQLNITIAEPEAAQSYEMVLSGNLLTYPFVTGIPEPAAGDISKIFTADPSAGTAVSASGTISWPLNSNRELLKIINRTSGKTMLSTSLLELISKVPNSNPDCEKTFNLIILYKDINRADPLITISVNGWVVLTSTEELN